MTTKERYSPAGYQISISIMTEEEEMAASAMVATDIFGENNEATYGGLRRQLETLASMAHISCAVWVSDVAFLDGGLIASLKNQKGTTSLIGLDGGVTGLSTSFPLVPDNPSKDDGDLFTFMLLSKNSETIEFLKNTLAYLFTDGQGHHYLYFPRYSNKAIAPGAEIGLILQSFYKAAGHVSTFGHYAALVTDLNQLMVKHSEAIRQCREV